MSLLNVGIGLGALTTADILSSSPMTENFLTLIIWGGF